MKLNEIQAGRKIVLVCGNLCSGKGTYCSSQYPDYEHIGISSIVRALSNSNTRSELLTTKHLDQRIADKLIEMVAQHRKVVIDGIRQITILQALEQAFPGEIENIIWLDVPDDVAQERFAKRSAIKDDQTYDDARAGDRNLGIEEVEQYIRQNHSVVPN